ncbi:MAG: hypothetical protein H7X99_11605 [Saprospiraceae bacterium]|nr:hypothetical protein [Saprospiraceae bacterium]
MKVRILILWYIIFTTYVDAQMPMSDHVGPEQGLSQNSVRCLLQDRSGKMWIGTSDGLNYYDGYEFIHVKNEPFNAKSLSSDQINCLYENKTGRIWVGTKNGLDILTSNGLWLFNIPPLCGEGKNITHIVALNENNIAVSSSDKLYIIHIKDEKNHTIRDITSDISGKIKTIISDSKGNLWAASTDGIFKLYVDSNEIKLLKKIKNDHLSAFIPWQMAIDKYDNLWITASGTLLFLNTRTDTIYLPEYSKSDNIWTSLYIDQSGDLWLGSFEKGVETFTIGFNGRLSPSANVNADNANMFLRNTMIMCIYEGDDQHEDIVWIGTGEKGLYKYSRSKNVFKHYEYYFIKSDQSASFYFAILKDENFLWAGTSKGLYKQNLTTQKVDRVKTQSYKQEEGFFTLCKDSHGTVWAGSDLGLYYLQKGKKEFRTFRFPDIDNYNLKIIKIKEDRNGNLWFCTNKGLFALVNGKTFKDFTHIISPSFIDPKKIIISDIEEDFHNGFWLSTSEGLMRMKDHTVKVFRHDISHPNGMMDNTIVDIFCDSEGNIWLCTTKGLSKLTIKNDEFCFDHFTDKDGLPNSFVYGILEANDKSIWISCNHGLVKINLKDNTIRNFRANEGLIREEFNSGAAYKDENGHLYFGGLELLISFNPAQLLPNKHLTKLILKSIKVMDQELNLSSISEKFPLKMTHNEKFLRLKLAAIDFTNPPKNQYAYKIAGLHNEWIQNENERVISLLNLPSGNHILEIKAANSDGVWNETDIISIPIIVEAPVWRQSWFLFSCLFLCMVIGYILFKNHIRRKLMIEKIRLEENERVRKIAAQDMHDDFGNTLTRISILSKLAESKLDQNNTYEAKTLLKKIIENSTRLYNGTKDFIWALNPESDNLWETLVRIKDFAEDAMSSSGLNFNAYGINENLKNYQLKPGVNRHVVMIMKEAITNTLKHAEATVAELSVNIENQSFEITWKDNGKGTPNVSNIGNGITNMKTRAIKNGGKLSILRPEKGTKILLQLNLKHNESANI